MRLTVRSFIPPVAALIAAAAVQSTAHAHFIWATIENGQARFALLENLEEAPNPQFEKYVADLAPMSGGDKLTLGPAKEGARYANLAKGHDLVTVESTVGAKEREGKPYLLVYNAKGAARLDAAQMQANAPAEVIARQENKELVISVLQKGKPVGKTEVWAQWPGQSEWTTLQTDGNSTVRTPWVSTSRSGFVGIRAMVTEAKPGETGGKKYATIHRWATLTFPVAATASAQADKPFTQILRASYGVNHEVVSNAAFNVTLFEDKLTKKQLEIHLQQRALVHNETHRILTGADPALRVPYGAAQKHVLVLLFTDLVAMGSGWPTEPQARPLTKAFLQELRDSEKKGPYFALGVQHVYYGGITNGGRMIGKKIGETVGFTPTYYEKSDGYEDYLPLVNKISDPEARAEMIRGGKAAYQYIIASSNEDVFKAK